MTFQYNTIIVQRSLSSGVPRVSVRFLVSTFYAIDKPELCDSTPKWPAN